MRTVVTRVLSVIVTAFFAVTGVQAGPQEEPAATAVPVMTAPVVDGALNDLAWTGAVPITEFLQRDPRQGEPASERTEVRIVYTRDAIYVGFHNYDSEAASLVATERRRDEDLTRDDSVAVLLDTFHDHRNASVFRTNVLGTEFDALVTDEGRDINTAWDERWEVATNVDEDGWTAEFMIPFKSLRMGQQEPMIWGLNFERLIRRKNEAVYWTNYSRDFKFEAVSQAGQLKGLENLQLGLRLRVKPFLLAGFDQLPRAGGGTRTNNLSNWGLEVLKYRPSAGLTLDLTYKTDFAQTEVDDLVTNIDRFPLFFPERREFFLEGAGIFEAGTVGSRDVMLFFSRRIGLSPTGLPIPIVAGAKLSGRQGPYSIGVINMQTESLGNIRANNFTVGRIKRDVLGRSAIGATFTNRQSSVNGDHNRVYAADGNFVFARNLSISSFVARSETPGLNAGGRVPLFGDHLPGLQPSHSFSQLPDNWSGSGRVYWDSDFLIFGGEYLLVQRNFQSDLGWVPRRDQKRSTLQFGIRPRPAASDLIRQWVVRARMDFTQNQAGKQESMTYHFFTVEALFQSGDRFVADFHRNFERLFEPFEIRPNITIPVGSYRGWNGVVNFNGAPQRRISGPLFRYRYERGFYRGTNHEFRVQPQIAVNDTLSLNVGYAFDDVNMPWGNFTSHVVNNRINYAFSNRWLTSATIQYSNLRKLVNYRFRLNYIYRPGDDLFIIYNEGRNVAEYADGFLGRSIMVKWTYSFDF